MCRTRSKFYHDIRPVSEHEHRHLPQPDNHKFTIPVAVSRNGQEPNIIGMKDSHRTTQAFIICKNRPGKISFVNQSHLYPYYSWERSCWSTKFGWDRGDPLFMSKSARRQSKSDGVIDDLGGVGAASPFQLGNKRPQEFADYCKVGPLGRPFVRSQSKACRGEGACRTLEDAQREIPLGRAAFPYAA